MIRWHLVVPALFLVATTASASEPLPETTLFPEAHSSTWRIDWTSAPSQPTPLHDAVVRAVATAHDQTAPPPVVATEYSHAYQVRAKIHRYASFATLPLFATEIALGQSLYNEPGGGKKTAHAIVGGGIGSLFAVNTVTGVMNLWEARKDPVGHTRRMTHGLLMMAANAGFFATFLAAPDSEHADFTEQRSTHRNIALTSIGLATAGYLTMLFGGK